MTAPVLPSANIVLAGFMGSGKSRVGAALAEATGRPLIDTDEVVARAARMPIPDIFASEGEAGFRRRERDAIRKASRAKAAVIATGGGALVSPDNVRALRSRGLIVYLKVSAAELERRLESSAHRPLIDGIEGIASGAAARRRKIRALLTAREPAYEAAADLIVSADASDPASVARRVLECIARNGDTQVSTVMVRVASPYPVVIGRGILARAAELASIPPGAQKALIVSHPRVWRLWGAALREGLASAGLTVSHATFPEGEEKKTMETAGRLYAALAKAQLHRSDLVVALGGGVVGDVAGFVAATYYRGVAVLQVPTTLLAMVDAAIGGKTGFNLPQGKNLVGAFHHPCAVLSDLDSLRTLPERELRGGLAEVAKYACIADPSLGELLASRRSDVWARGDVLGEIVERSVRIKAGIVAGDERECGDRGYLNYGHTLGHALEAWSWSSRVSQRGLHHGEAISVGMLYAAELAAACGAGPDTLPKHHRELLEGLGLPSKLPAKASWEELRAFMQMDKKYARGLRFVLLEDLGKPRLHSGLSPDVLLEAYRKVTR